MIKRIEARYDNKSGIFIEYIENQRGPRDSNWPRLLNTLLNENGDPILPQQDPPVGKLMIVRNNKWTVVDDNRGIWYNKLDGSKIVIDDSNINDIDISMLVKEPPTCHYPAWDSSIPGWIVNENAKRHVEDTTWEIERQRLLHATPESARSALYSSLRYQLSDGLDSDYNRNQPLISFQGENITVDQANQLFLYYFAEGNTYNVETIQQALSEAKKYIRSLIK